MAESFRLPLRMDCDGIDLVSPLDRMPKKAFPYLFNARVLQEGRIDGRPGYSQYLKLLDGDYPNSIRRLNDPTQTLAPSGYVYVGGGGHNLYLGAGVGSYVPIDTGYSGNPLSLIPFQPDQSTETWMYFYDPNKMGKVNPAGTLRAIGVVPPNVAPQIEYVQPAWVNVDYGQDAGVWSASGDASSPTDTDRTDGSSPTIDDILYNSGTTGWCCINPDDSNTAWMGDRMAVILDLGGASEEYVVVREVHNAIDSTVVAAIQYDFGVSGLCSIVFAEYPDGLARNSLITLGSETVRVLEVNLTPDGSQYSIRVQTTGTVSVGDTVDGLLSWYCYTVLPHVATETIDASYVKVTQVAGIGSLTQTINVNASAANGRQINPADDYLHISVFLDDPAKVVDLRIMLDLNISPTFDFDNPGESYIWIVSRLQLQDLGASAASWVEIVIPISAATKYGSDPTRNLSTITGLGLQLTCTDACDWGFDWWYLFGTYGPTVQPNSPVGIQYSCRFRDSSTGAKSVPSPLTRYGLFPLREGVIITLPVAVQEGVNTSDIYRIGGAVTEPLYVGSTSNDGVNIFDYVDSLSDLAILAANQPADPEALRPWPILGTPWQGTCKVSGTSILWKSGTQFDLNLISGSVILIDGKAYQTYAQPRSGITLEITQSAGYRDEVWFQVASPIIAGQPLPYAFGPLEGPFAPVVFGLGDELNGGTLYFSNFNDADSASSRNSIILANPGNNLVSGAAWNGMAFAGNRDDIFCVRYAFLSGEGQPGSQPFQWKSLNAPSGIWSRWACCACPIGVAYLGRDGIYIANENGAENISDEKLYPLFPHDGQPAYQVNSGSNIILPVDMSLVNFLRLSYCDEALRFSYIDTGGNYNTLIYQIYKKRWFLNNYAHAISFHYLVEGSVDSPLAQDIVALNLSDYSISIMGGNTDDGEDINTIVLTPSMDGGDERTQKLYVDTIIQAGGTGTVAAALAYDNSQTFSPVSNLGFTGDVDQGIIPVASLSDLALYRNVACKMAWTGGPDGPQVYAFEPSGFVQPYLSTRFTTPIGQFSFPDWKHMRRMYAALISNSDVIITFKCQDGRQFGPYTIQSTLGQYRILPQMLDQGLKDLAFGMEIEGNGSRFAFFPDDWTVEVKDWLEETYIKLAVFKA